MRARNSQHPNRDRSSLAGCYICKQSSSTFLTSCQTQKRIELSIRIEKLIKNKKNRERKAHGTIDLEVEAWRARRRRLSSPPSRWWPSRWRSGSSAPTSGTTATSRGSRRTPRWTRGATTSRSPSSATPLVYFCAEIFHHFASAFQFCSLYYCNVDQYVMRA